MTIPCDAANVQHQGGEGRTRCRMGDDGRWSGLFAQVPVHMAGDGRLSGWDWRVLVALLAQSRKDRRSKCLVPKGIRARKIAQMLREDTESGRVQVRRAVRRLEQFGYVRVMRPKQLGKQNAGAFSTYDLNPVWDVAQVADVLDRARRAEEELPLGEETENNTVLGLASSENSTVPTTQNTAVLPPFIVVQRALSESENDRSDQAGPPPQENPVEDVPRDNLTNSHSELTGSSFAVSGKGTGNGNGNGRDIAEDIVAEIAAMDFTEKGGGRISKQSARGIAKEWPEWTLDDWVAVLVAYQDDCSDREFVPTNPGGHLRQWARERGDSAVARGRGDAEREAEIREQRKEEAHHFGRLCYTKGGGDVVEHDLLYGVTRAGWQVNEEATFGTPEVAVERLTEAGARQSKLTVFPKGEDHRGSAVPDAVREQWEEARAEIEAIGRPRAAGRIVYRDRQGESERFVLEAADLEVAEAWCVAQRQEQIEASAYEDDHLLNADEERDARELARTLRTWEEAGRPKAPTDAEMIALHRKCPEGMATEHFAVMERGLSAIATEVAGGGVGGKRTAEWRDAVEMLVSRVRPELRPVWDEVEQLYRAWATAEQEAQGSRSAAAGS